MTATLLAQNTFGFADGNAGHVVNLGSAPNVGELDVLCVNSNTVVSTPSGFTAAPTLVGSQGAYIFRRLAAGGEGSTVTITTSGNHDTAVSWSRWSDCIAIDKTATGQIDGSGGSSTPAVNTGALAETDELVVAFGALHSQSGVPASPVWSAGYTALNTSSQGSGSSGVVGFIGYRTDAGTAAETPQVTWSGGTPSDRYMLVLTLTTNPETPQLTGVSAVTIGATGDLVEVNNLTGTSAVTIGATGTLLGSTPNSATLISQLAAELLSCLCAAVAANPGAPQHCCYRVGTEPVHDIDARTGIDLCCEGLAYVLLRDVYPSVESFPDNDIVRQADARCTPPAWGVGLRMGIVRCIPHVSDCTENNEAFVQNLYDVQSINAAWCCFRDFMNTSEDFMGMSLVAERQTQGSTSGGCTERYVNMVAQIPNLDCDCG